VRREDARTRRQALTDELTGLPNRRALNLRLDAAIAAGRPTGLVLIDLDGFKEINDALGYHVGDLLLERLGERLAAHTGGPDLLARLGGDEFAVLVAASRRSVNGRMRLVRCTVGRKAPGASRSPSSSTTSR
jgi:diguanylate cyclase (GGDEF)-like protein